MMILAINMENLEKSLLISLVVVLGIILYIKLIQNLKKKRLSSSFSYISGYDVNEKSIVVNIGLVKPLNSNLVLTSEKGETILNIPFTGEYAGNHSVEFSKEGLDHEFLYLSFNTENQKITKKIYLNPQG